MALQIIDLPFAYDALEPHLSRSAVASHYDEHYIGHITALNECLAGSGFEQQGLEDMVMEAPGAVFRHAAEAWNHRFYWDCLTPFSRPEPVGPIGTALKQQFGSYARFREAFEAEALAAFGSCWVWLVRTADGLEIITTGQDDHPLRRGVRPLLACDVWEHAYYIDYRNARGEYLTAFWQIVDWDFPTKLYLS